MVYLEDSIDIEVPFEKLKNWVYNIEREFSHWCPTDGTFELISGELDVGSKLRFVETVDGVTYHVTGTIINKIDTVDYFRFEFLSSTKLVKITFIGEALEGKSRFTHIEEFGIQGRAFSKIINYFIYILLFKKIANFKAIQKNMIEHNVDLKYILEGRKR